MSDIYIMTPTHEIWLKGELFKLFTTVNDTILEKDGSVYLAKEFSLKRLAAIGYEIREIVISLENE